MKTWMTTLVLSAGFLLGAQTPNLIKNPDFDRNLDREFRYDAARGVMKSSIITEDRTWNRCLKVEAKKYTEDKKRGKVFYTAIRFGGDGKTPGFAVKPNTIYSFSMELKGNLRCQLFAWSWNGTNYWKDMKKLKLVGESAFKSSDNWTELKVTFQTGADTKYAAVGLNIFGAEKYKTLPELGQYVLLDRVKVTEKTDLLAAASKGTPGTPESAVQKKKAVIPNRPAAGFVTLKTANKPAADTEFTVIPEADFLTVKIRCLEPRTEKVKHAFSGCGSQVWNDDLVEIFFGGVSKDRELSQFVVSAGGGRWMGRGSGGKVDPRDYERWSAKTAVENDCWTAEVKIPYDLLGWKKRPASGTIIPFNLGRTRTPVPETSSYAFAGDGFHTVKNYAVLWLDQPGAWFAARKSVLAKQAENLNKDLAAEIAKWQLNDPAEAFFQAEVFQRRMEEARLGNRTHVVTPIRPSADPAIPMIPAELASPPKKVRIRAAGNEFKALPLAVTNLLNRPEEYRIVIAAVNGNVEETSLKRSDEILFPAEKIRLYRGIRVKDDDGKNHGLRYDPLAPMDITSTVVVMPKEAAPVWAVFDTAGVPPGIYRGMIRVIPLGEAAVKEKGKGKGKGKLKLPVSDLPLEFEVLPFEISRRPAIPQFFFGAAYGGRETFRMMMEHDIDTFLITPWRIKASFNADGSLQSSDPEKAERELMNLKEYAREIGMEKDLRIGIAYSAYPVFRDVHAGKKFKWGTPEWKKAWQAYVKVMDGLRKKCGIPSDACFAEIQDEPKPEHLDELLAAAKAAHEIAPDLNLMVTIAAWSLPMEKMRELSRYVSYWCFWGSKYFGPQYAGFMKELRSAGRNVSLYSCDTSLRLDLQKYYLTHAWRALAYGADMCNLYEFMTYRHASADWKQKTAGSTALMASGHPVTTIRLECLRIGSTDIKYMKKLEEMLKKNTSAAPALRSEIEMFLKETPKKVGVTSVHDPAVSAAAREKAIDYILKLMK